MSYFEKNFWNALTIFLAIYQNYNGLELVSGAHFSDEKSAYFSDENFWSKNTLSVDQVTKSDLPSQDTKQIVFKFEFRHITL